MQKRIAIKNHYQEVQLIGKRSMFALFICFLLVGLLIWRLAYLQIYKHELYTTLSTKNWLDLVPVEPTRGLIYDRNGVLLAENVPVFSLDIIPFQAKNLAKNLVELKKIIKFSENDIQQIKKILRQHRNFDEIPLKLRLTEEEVARFTENQHLFPGIFIKGRLMRRYPYGESFSHVLGYVGRINVQELTRIDQINYSASHYIGKNGVEKFYEDELHGGVGYQEVENDASGKPIRILKEIPGTPGNNIYLTIDSGLQFVAQKALNGHRGAVVAIQPATGQVLAMVSEPAYDPNIFVQGINQKDFQTLQSSENKPLYNRAIRGVYPLASTIKPFFALEGLQTGVTTPEYTIFDQGSYRLNNNSRPFHDWWRPGHGYVDLRRAIAISCDVYFYDLANKLGIKRMDQILTAFGFGALTGIDMPDELPGVVSSPEWKQKVKGINWYGGDTIMSGIGQGYMQATPLQLATATATLANRGARFIPYLLLAEQNPGKDAVMQQPIPIEKVTVADNEYWDIVINAMQDVVDARQGTAFYTYGRHPHYSIAAKTGTAQVSRRRNPEERDKQDTLPEKLRDHHIFVAFAPVENPQIAIAVITENSDIAAQTTRQIFDYYLGKNQNANRPTKIETQKAGT